MFFDNFKVKMFTNLRKKSMIFSKIMSKNPLPGSTCQIEREKPFLLTQFEINCLRDILSIAPRLDKYS